MNGHAVYTWLARCWCDDDDIVSSSGKTSRKILKVKLDSADARVVPVGDEGDFHTGRGKRGTSEKQVLRRFAPQDDGATKSALGVATSRGAKEGAIFSNAASTRSICSAECSADIDTRMRHACAGTAGGMIG